jgi:UDP-N-acetylglucosamine 4,6-dehydratase/5-epimerase
VAANNLAGDIGTRFSLVRYGNVVGSRGSVAPLFQRLLSKGATELPITDPRMTRFWITLTEGVEFVLSSLGRMHGGEIFVPKIPSMNIMDLASAIAPECKTEVVGIRPGEKLHEVMVPEDDARNSVELDDRYVILPSFGLDVSAAYASATRPPDNFRYGSDTNTKWLTTRELTEMVTRLTGTGGELA